MILEIIVILILLLIFCYSSSKSEHLENTVSPQEAIAALASMYNSGNVITNRLQLGNKFSFSGVGDKFANDDWLRLMDKDGNGYYGGIAAGKLWTDGPLNAGLVATNNLTTNLFNVDGGKIVYDKNVIKIGDKIIPIIFNDKKYEYDGIMTSGNDITSAKINTESDAIKMCIADPSCANVYKNGDNYWLKRNNNTDWLIGSPDWPIDVFFAGNYNDQGGQSNRGSSIGPASSFEDCWNKAKEKNAKIFNYYIKEDRKSNPDNCRALTSRGNDSGKTIFVKRH